MPDTNQIKDYPRDIDAELESMWHRFTACLDKVSTHTRIKALEMKVNDAEKVLTDTRGEVKDHDKKILDQSSLLGRLKEKILGR